MNVPVRPIPALEKESVHSLIHNHFALYIRWKSVITDLLLLLLLIHMFQEMAPKRSRVCGAEGGGTRNEGENDVFWDILIY